MKTLYLSLLLAIAGVQPALSQSITNGICPEGKAPVEVTTPSGKSNTICVPNSALPGLENAGENATVTINPIGCPCFSTAEAEALLTGVTFTYYENQWDSYPDGEIGACKTVYIQAYDPYIILGAGTRTNSPTQGCLTTDIIPVSIITPNGCYKASGNSTLSLNPITPDESAACTSILKRFAQ